MPWKSAHTADQFQPLFFLKLYVFDFFFSMFRSESDYSSRKIKQHKFYVNIIKSIMNFFLIKSKYVDITFQTIA